jgi:hypothetical protein
VSEVPSAVTGSAQLSTAPAPAANPDAGKVRLTLHHAGQAHECARPFSVDMADAITFIGEALGMRVVRSLPL